MMKNLKRYLTIVMILLLICIALYIIYFFTFEAVAMDKGIGKLHYSNSLRTAEKEQTVIKKYIVYDSNKKKISNAWLEYARSYNVFDEKKIEKDETSLSVQNEKKIDNIIHWEAFFRDKKLTVFKDKNILRITDADKNMDTIKLKSNENVCYIISTN